MASPDHPPSRPRPTALLGLALPLAVVVLPSPVPAGGALAAIVALLGLDVALVASRTALDALRPVHLRMGDDAFRARLTRLVDDRPSLAAGVGAASTLVRFGLAIMASVVGQTIGAGVAPDPSTVFASTVIACLAVAVVDVLLTAGLARGLGLARPARVARFTEPLSRLVASLLWPVVTPAAALSVRLSHRGQADPDHAGGGAEAEIKTIVETAQESGDIEEEERELIQSVFDFTDTVAREVMTPRTDLDALPVDTDPAEIVRMITETGHSRIPLYEETDDQIVGIVHAKDVLTQLAAGRVVNPREIMRPAVFIPENKGLRELLGEMKAARAQLAVVQDDFGGTAGIVTIEDIVEELVGDIVDEYDDEVRPVEATGDGWSVEGKTHLDDFSRLIGAEFASEDFDTIGGYVFGLFGRQPKEGETIEADGYRFEVAQTDGRRILRLSVSPAPVEMLAA